MVKSRKEIEVDIKFGRVIIIVLIIGCLILAIVGSLWEEKLKRSEEKLEECKKQVPIWTLKVECIDHALASYIYFEDNYTDYELYQEIVEGFGDLKQFEHCEIIE